MVSISQKHNIQIRLSDRIIPHTLEIIKNINGNLIPYANDFFSARNNFPFDLENAKAIKIPNKITIEIKTTILKFKVNTNPPVFILPNISVSKRVRSDSCIRAIIAIENFFTLTPIIKNTMHSPRFMSLITHSAAMDMRSPYMFISPHKIINRPRRKTIANIEILKRVVVRILGNLPGNMKVRNAETTGIKISKYINKNSILSPAFIHKVFSNVF